MNTPYEFTNNWFDMHARGIWTDLLPQLKPVRVLEIGAYESAASCFLVEQSAATTELHCVDTWEGGIENKIAGIDMGVVERRFQQNVRTPVAAASRPIDCTSTRAFPTTAWPACWRTRAVAISTSSTWTARTRRPTCSATRSSPSGCCA